MKLFKFLVAGAIAFTTAANVYSQGTNCANAEGFCTDEGVDFPASTSTIAETGPDYGCLGDQPNPAWYFLQIGSSGSIDIEMSNSADEDIDFICWGPYNDLSSSCSNLTGDPNDPFCGFFDDFPCGNIVDCSFDIASTEVVNIPNAQVGDYYVLLITNYSGEPTNISAEQVGGTGATDCDVLIPPCDIVTFNATPGPCDAANNYTISGSFTYQDNPGTGTITVVANNGTNNFTQTFNPPFVNGQVYNFSIPNVPGNGASTSVTVSFSADPSCTQTVNITAPACVDPPCDILTLNAAAGPCDAAFNYTLSGTFSYTQNPGTGTLVVTANNGTNNFTQTFNPPFTDNQNFNFSIADIPGNGAATTVTVAFSDAPGCSQTFNLTAPPCLPEPCSFINGTFSMTDCDADSSYILSGTVLFDNSPETGSLVISGHASGDVFSQTFNAPFVNNQPLSFSFPGLYADGEPVDMQAIFTDEPACAYNFPDFNAPECECDVNASFSANPAVMTLENTASQMINSTDNAISYVWDFGDGGTSSLENPLHLFPFDSTGNYQVMLVATSLLGCTDTARMTVIVQEDLIYYVPNSFTPDGDEFNQMFKPVFTSGFDPYNFEMLIFNRWGEVVFESKDASVGWDGTYHGEQLNSGVYTWTIKFKRRDADDRKTVNGHVTLMR